MLFSYHLFFKSRECHNSYACFKIVVHIKFRQKVKMLTQSLFPVSLVSLSSGQLIRDVGTDWYLRNGNSPTKNWDVPCIDLSPEAEFLDEIQTKVLLLKVTSAVCSFALRFLFLQTHATSYSFFSMLLYTVKEKGGKPA